MVCGVGLGFCLFSRGVVAIHSNYYLANFFFYALQICLRFVNFLNGVTFFLPRETARNRSRFAGQGTRALAHHFFFFFFYPAKTARNRSRFRGTRKLRALAHRFFFRLWCLCGWHWVGKRHDRHTKIALQRNRFAKARCFSFTKARFAQPQRKKTRCFLPRLWRT